MKTARATSHVEQTAEIRWTVTIDAGDVDHVIDVRQLDGRLLVLAAGSDPPQGWGSNLSPARLVMLDRAGHCLHE